MAATDFSAYMVAQVAVIEASGLRAVTWVACYARTFRRAWDATHTHP